MEKVNFTEPVEEFIDDKGMPSKPKSPTRFEPSTSSARAQNVKPAGHQDNKPEVFEPGVEG